MKKDTIVQFVCFVTDLDINDFGTKWESFAKPFLSKNADITLEERTGRSRFRYVSRIEWPQGDAVATFMDKKRIEGFPEHTVKMMQAGGYTPLKIQQKNNEEGLTKVIAFVSHNENDIAFYSSLPAKFTNSYQAYYESCSYAYVFEYFVDESEVESLTASLKTRHGIEVGAFKESMVPEL